MKKKLLLILILIFLFFILVNINVYAHTDTIEYIDITIEIDEYGNAYVVENWNVVSAARSGYYKTCDNIQDSQIMDFVVKDENGTVYQYLENWDINLLPEEKINKCGINNIENGVELCWGVQEEGFHIFTLKYYIKNFVHEYNDSQAIYWSLIPVQLNPKPTDFSINIILKNKIDDVSVIGTKNVNINTDLQNITIENTSTLLKEEGVSVLIEIPKNSFDTTSTIDKFVKDLKKEIVPYDKTYTMYIIAGVGMLLLVLYLGYKIYKLR